MATVEKRKSSDGTVRYRVRVRIRGEKPRTRTFKRKTDAQLWASKVESDLGHGTYVPTTADRRRTLAELIDKFIAEHLPTRPRNADSKKISAQLKWWNDHAGYLTLDKVTPEATAGFRSELLVRRTGRRTPQADDDSPSPSISQATANRYWPPSRQSASGHGRNCAGCQRARS